MSRLIVHLLLSLSLVFNALAAPWAMAHMGQEGEGGAVAHSSVTGSDPGAVAHAGHGTPVPQHDHGDPDNASGGSCCDATTCQCGCVLPPVVPFAALPLVAEVIVVVPSVPVVAHAVVQRTHPPFRPPAV